VDEAAESIAAADVAAGRLFDRLYELSKTVTFRELASPRSADQDSSGARKDDHLQIDGLRSWPAF
jgi:hypothetical protein